MLIVALDCKFSKDTPIIFIHKFKTWYKCCSQLFYIHEFNFWPVGNTAVVAAEQLTFICFGFVTVRKFRLKVIIFNLFHLLFFYFFVITYCRIGRVHLRYMSAQHSTINSSFFNEETKRPKWYMFPTHFHLLLLLQKWLNFSSIIVSISSNVFPSVSGRQ